jgi:hypothetical protein
LSRWLLRTHRAKHASVSSKTFGKKMPVNPTVLDLAYAKLEAFGPERGTPVDKRLKKEFPRLSSTEREEVAASMKLVSETVWALAQRGGEAKMKKSEILLELQAAHPFLQNLGLKQAAFLVNYYAWHKGYDQ